MIVRVCIDISHIYGHVIVKSIDRKKKKRMRDVLCDKEHVREKTSYTQPNRLLLTPSDVCES